MFLCFHPHTHFDFTDRPAHLTINTCAAEHSPTHTDTSLHLLRACQSPFPLLLGSLCFSSVLRQSSDGCQHFQVLCSRKAGCQSAGGLQRQGLRQRFLVYFHELLTGHPAAADSVSKRVRRGLQRIEKASKHYCGAEWRAKK